MTPPPDPTSTKGTLSDLDGFDKVDIQVVGMHVGPLTVARLTLERDERRRPYARQACRPPSPALDRSATFAGGQIGGGLGGFLGGIAGSAMPGAERRDPHRPRRRAAQRRAAAPRAVARDGSVAGLPAGPFVEALLTALAGVSDGDGLPVGSLGRRKYMTTVLEIPGQPAPDPQPAAGPAAGQPRRARLAAAAGPVAAHGPRLAAAAGPAGHAGPAARSPARPLPQI